MKSSILKSKTQRNGRESSKRKFKTNALIQQNGNHPSGVEHQAHEEAQDSNASFVMRMFKRDKLSEHALSNGRKNLQSFKNYHQQPFQNNQHWTVLRNMY